LFRLSGTPVYLQLDDPIFIENGETVRVVGRQNENGVFEALAYNNRSSGVSGNAGGALFRRLFVILIVVIGVLVIATAPFAATLMSRFVRDDHMVADSVAAFCAIYGAPLALVGWLMNRRYRGEIRRIERLLNDA
jgi:hypothetical protein